MWYDSSLISSIAGAAIGIIGTMLGSWSSYLLKQKEETRNIIKDFVICNPKIFNNVFRAAAKESINELELREAVTEDPNIFFLLPENLRILFVDIYKLYQSNPDDYYSSTLPKIKIKLIEINSEIISFGYNAFDTKVTEES